VVGRNDERVAHDKRMLGAAASLDFSSWQGRAKQVSAGPPQRARRTDVLPLSPRPLSLLVDAPLQIPLKSMAESGSSAGGSQRQCTRSVLTTWAQKGAPQAVALGLYCEKVLEAIAIQVEWSQRWDRLDIPPLSSWVERHPADCTQAARTWSAAPLVVGNLPGRRGGAAHCV
jgi:hypothetical protein